MQIFLSLLALFFTSTAISANGYFEQLDTQNTQFLQLDANPLLPQKIKKQQITTAFKPASNPYLPKSKSIKTFKVKVAPAPVMQIPTLRTNTNTAELITLVNLAKMMQPKIVYVPVPFPIYVPVYNRTRN